jgi:hypothetical protein
VPAAGPGRRRRRRRGGAHAAAVERAAQRAGLTGREKDVVEQVVCTEGTIQEIAAALSPVALRVTTRPVKNALNRAS